MRLITIGASIACLVFAAGAAQAKTVHFTSDLKGSGEVPANSSSGTGHLDATLDTGAKTLKYKVTYSGLSGPPTMAHFHGPAAPGVNAPPVISVSNLKNPMTGSATLNDRQITELTSGQWYFNIHTKAHPGGEIRGQVSSQ